MVGDVRFRPEDHQLIRPVIIVRGKAPKDMKNGEDYWEVLEVVPGEPLMQKPELSAVSLATTPDRPQSLLRASGRGEGPSSEAARPEESSKPSLFLDHLTSHRLVRRLS